MPVVFAAHGAPVLLDDPAWMAELAAWADALPKPKGVLMVSAHWEERPTTLGATRTVPLVYDFYGFPERYYRTRYPAPGRRESSLARPSPSRASGWTAHSPSGPCSSTDGRTVTHEGTQTFLRKFMAEFAGEA